MKTFIVLLSDERAKDFYINSIYSICAKSNVWGKYTWVNASPDNIFLYCFYFVMEVEDD